MVVGSLKDDDANPICPRKWNCEFADAPEIGEQRRPSFTGEELTTLIAELEGQEQMAVILFAASGLRPGELFGLEVKHFVGKVVKVQQSVWSGEIQKPQTKSAFRFVDLHSSVSTQLRIFIGDRKEGFALRLAMAHRGIRATSSAVSCILLSRNWESRSRVSTSSGAFGLLTSKPTGAPSLD